LFILLFSSMLLPSAGANARWNNPRVQAALERIRTRCIECETTSPQPAVTTPGTTQSLEPTLPVTNSNRGLFGKKVVIDAGHGGHDSGATSDGVREKDINLEVAQCLAEALTRRGVIVTMIRDDDTFVDLDERVRLSNTSKSDCFISIHTNDTDASCSPSGVETYWYTDQSQRLANCAYHALVERLGANGRFVMCRGFRVVRNAVIPATLVEIGYIGNSSDRASITNEVYQERLAQALTWGLEQYFNGASPRVYAKTFTSPVKRKVRKAKAKTSKKGVRRKRR